MAERDGTGGPRTIVVGADGSAGSDTAVDWAADLAARWGTVLRIVHVGPEPQPADWLVELAGAHGGRPETHAPVAAADPDDAVNGGLLEAAADADLIVLGSRSHGTGLLAGQIADGVASGAGVAVAVVRAAKPGKAVVVGVVGPGDTDAIRFGADLAMAWGAPLRLVHAWSDVATHAGERLRRVDEDWDTLRDRARAVARAARVVATDRHPGLTVDDDVVEGTALRALLDAADGARALVVGPYGAVPPEGMQLGSSSRALVGFAPCTVVVARGERR